MRPKSTKFSEMVVLCSAMIRSLLSQNWEMSRRRCMRKWRARSGHPSAPPRYSLLLCPHSDARSACATSACRLRSEPSPKGGAMLSTFRQSAPPRFARDRPRSIRLGASTISAKRLPPHRGRIAFVKSRVATSGLIGNTVQCPFFTTGVGA
jgi:hypothetical protein